MIIFRLSKKQYANELNGKGAAKFGNRWNSKGVEIIYTAENRSLAMAEVAVHLTIATLPRDYVMIEIDVPDSIQVDKLDDNLLGDDWNQFPHTRATQKIGDDFIDAKDTCLLKVPSAVVKGDHNYLINPYHSDFKKIKIKRFYDFPFDKRIFK